MRGTNNNDDELRKEIERLKRELEKWMKTKEFKRGLARDLKKLGFIY